MTGEITLFSSWNQNGNIEAKVTQKDEVVFFELHGEKQYIGVRRCWVRNLLPAPHEWSKAHLACEVRPPLPQCVCAHPRGALPLCLAQLRIVWFEGGDGAALLEFDKLLAVIAVIDPEGGFGAFAHDCTGESALCSPLAPMMEVFAERVAKAEEFWADWRKEPTQIELGENHPWPVFRATRLAYLESLFGPCSACYSRDPLYPPCDLVRFDRPDGIVLVTIGMSIRPQPHAELFPEDPRVLRRVELGLCLGAEFAKADLSLAMQWIGSNVIYPWTQYRFLRTDDIINGYFVPNNSEFTAGYLHPRPPGSRDIHYPEFRGDPVTLLWITPMTRHETELALQSGQENIERTLAKAGCQWTFHNRRVLKPSLWERLFQKQGSRQTET